MVLGELPKLTLDEREAKWADIYVRNESLLSAVGDTAYLQVPLADQNHMETSDTIVRTIGTEQVAFTVSQSKSLFGLDTPVSYIGPWGIPVIPFNGSDVWLQAPNADFWKDDQSGGLQEPSFCFALWINVVGGASAQIIWAKSSAVGTGGDNWILYLQASERLAFRVIDSNANAYIGQLASAGGAFTDGLHHIAVTKHDDSEASASIILYADGEVLTSADNEDGTYADMQDDSTVVRIGAQSNGGSPLSSFLVGACLGPIIRAVGANAVWTPDVVRRLYQSGRALLGPAAGL